MIDWQLIGTLSVLFVACYYVIKVATNPKNYTIPRLIAGIILTGLLIWVATLWIT